MLKEKENVEVLAYNALLYHVWEMIPENLDDREQMRDNLKELYLNWLEKECDLRRDKDDFILLYQLFDRFLKMCKDIDKREFNRFVERFTTQIINQN